MSALTRSLLQSKYEVQCANANFNGNWNDVYGRIGKGKQYFGEKEWYEGEFMNNQFHGQGLYHFANGNEYSGEFKEGAISGHG